MIATINQPIVCADRAEWLRERQSVIGASDAAAIFGVGYADQNPVTVWHSKIEGKPTDDPKKAKLFRIGKLMEPSLRLIFADETGLPCDPAGEFTIYRHPDVPFVGATLDAITVHDEYGWCPVELKNVSNFARREWDDGQTPLKFQVQVQQQLAVTGATHGFLLGLVGGNEPIVKVIERNEAFIEALLAKLDEFWAFVKAKEMPPLDDSLATAKVLAKLWPEDNGRTVFGPDESVEWAIDLQLAKAAIKEFDAVATAAENKIKAAIGEATYLDLPHVANEALLRSAAQERFAETVKRVSAELKPRYSWKQQTTKHKAKEAYESSFRVLRACK